MPWNGKKRKRGNNPDSGGGDDYTPNDVPFSDAAPGTGEVPLGDLDNFVIPATDEKGTFVHVRLNIPPALERSAKIILRSNRFPYLDMGDLIRHALMRHLIWCTGLRGTIPRHIVSQLETIVEVCRDHELHAQSEEAFRKILDQINGLMERGEHGEATRLLNIIAARIDDAHPTLRQRQFKMKLLRQFGHVLGVDGTVTGDLGAMANGVGGSGPVIDVEVGSSN